MLRRVLALVPVLVLVLVRVLAQGLMIMPARVPVLATVPMLVPVYCSC